ncbi:MAG: hypothetical protein IPK16_00095 [Anaerolineales bacterium]|nr:hypothetical protein [Anaerolineales bacterium]
MSDIQPYLGDPGGCGSHHLEAGIQNKVTGGHGLRRTCRIKPSGDLCLDYRACQDLLVGDAQQLAQGILSLLEDPLAYNRLGTSGRRYVEEYHAWDSVAEKLENLYRAVITHDYTPKLPQSGIGWHHNRRCSTAWIRRCFRSTQWSSSLRFIPDFLRRPGVSPARRVRVQLRSALATTARQILVLRQRYIVVALDKVICQWQISTASASAGIGQPESTKSNKSGTILDMLSTRHLLVAPIRFTKFNGL